MTTTTKEAWRGAALALSFIMAAAGLGGCLETSADAPDGGDEFRLLDVGDLELEGFPVSVPGIPPDGGVHIGEWGDGWDGGWGGR